MFRGDEQLLRELATSCKDAKEKVRYLALHALCIECTVSQVSKIFCVDESTLYRRIERWETEKSVRNEPKSGRPPALDEKGKEEIKKLVEENSPKKHGINASFWDTKELQEYFRREGIGVSREAIRACLREMGARYVKAQIKYPEADLEQQKEFAKKFFEEKKKAGSTIMLFHDEMSAACSARKGYGWTLGKRLEIKAPRRYRQRVNCFGAVNPLSGEIIEMSSKDAKAPAFVRFLHKIDKKYRDESVVIYLDNLPVHKSAKVKKFFKKHAYAPRISSPIFSGDEYPGAVVELQAHEVPE